MNEVQLRAAGTDDVRRIFEWRNDPFIISRGTSQSSVTWEEHAHWFEQALEEDQHRRLYIIEVDGVPAGQVRFDRESGGACVISIYLLARFTNRGYGREAIRSGCARIVEEWSVDEIIARVRQDNPAGLSAFLRVGFVEREDREADHRVLVLPVSGATDDD
jgi:RimJ/RimL family protein N-acetyltransferase